MIGELTPEDCHLTSAFVLWHMDACDHTRLNK